MVSAPSIFELPVLRFAMSIAMTVLGSDGIDLPLGAVGQELHAYDAAVSVVDIERDTCIRACVLSLEGHEAHFDVVVKK